ncbi:hypothetical protein WAI453_010064 [Rhynchosporium graminicola]
MRGTSSQSPFEVHAHVHAQRSSSPYKHRTNQVYPANSELAATSPRISHDSHRAPDLPNIGVDIGGIFGLVVDKRGELLLQDSAPIEESGFCLAKSNSDLDSDAMPGLANLALGLGVGIDVALSGIDYFSTMVAAACSVRRTPMICAQRSGKRYIPDICTTLSFVSKVFLKEVGYICCI